MSNKIYFILFIIFIYYFYLFFLCTAKILNTDVRLRLMLHKNAQTYKYVQANQVYMI